MNLFSFFSVDAYPVKITSGEDRLNIGLSVEYYEDSKATLTFKDVLKLDNDNKFITTTKLPLNFGYSKSTYWLSFSVFGDTVSESGWYLELPYAPIDHVSLYVPNGKGDYVEHVGGDKSRVSDRDLNYKHPVFILGGELLPYQQYYLKVSSSGAINLPLFMWGGNNFVKHVNNLQTGMGIYFGIMFALFIYNLFLYVSVRDKDFLLCAFITLSYSLVQGAYNGMATLFLWSNFTWWSNNSLVFFAILLFLSIAVFTKSFLNIEQYSRFANLLMKFFIAYYIALYPLFFVLGYRMTSLATALMGILLLLVVFVLVLFTYARGYKPARLLLFAWSFFLFGLGLLLLKLMGVLPHVFLTEHSVQIGFTLNAILLSFALADRVNILRRQKEEAQKLALNRLEESERMKTAFLEETEQLVEERTRELEVANQKLVELASIDVLTGLYNRRVFNESLEREFNRAKRQNSIISLVIIDIDFFKNYNDYYGHTEGDRCLAELAEIFRHSISRATDTVARFGGEEFAVILSDTNLDGSIKIAEQIRKSVEDQCMAHKMAPLGYVTISCGVSSMSPKMNDQMSALINMADKALYKAKNGGRNMVAHSVY